MDLYVATNGRNAWSGTRPTPNKEKNDGPLATLEGARNRVRQLKGLGPSNTIVGPTSALSEPITVWIRGGRYELEDTVVFGPLDSYPVTYAAYCNEKPVFDGARRITGWKTTTVNGRKAWVVDLPEVALGKWSFRELFVNGRSALRPRFPSKGLFRMEAAPDMPSGTGWGGKGRNQTRFVAGKGHVKPFENLQDVEVVYVHFWIEERSPVESVDMDSRMVTMTRPSVSGLVGAHGTQLADYYFDNVFEELRKPGQWYLDRSAGKLYYLPCRGETPAKTEVYAPCCLQLLAVLGDVDQERHVEFVRFKGLTFRHTDWRHPSHDGAEVLGSSKPMLTNTPVSRRHSRGKRAAAAQAACDVPGVITFEAARNCTVEECVVEMVGWYGIEVGDGCRGIRLVGNTIRDMGAGGVKINGSSSVDRTPLRQTGLCRVTDNEIRCGGRIFHSAVGILSMNAFGIVMAHNHIHDLFYSGISCGWEWGYQENVSRDNIIEKNHIHDIGHGLLSDMGGIYTLGVQPGTVIRGNLIHDVHSAHYGGWCIYPDEGSSNIIIENNVCYDADREVFHQHYGRENTVRNNIFAFGGESVARYSRVDDHNGITFANNILVTDGKPIYSVGYGLELDASRLRSDLNLMFNTSSKRVCFVPRRKSKESLKQWRLSGRDIHSVVADPGFRNISKRDFSLKKNSPAFKIGFRPIDMRDVGPRRTGARD